MTKLNVKKILVIGSGGRENAICKAFKKSAQTTQIFALPGNAGTKKIAENIENININDFLAIVNFCQNNNIDFVFVGPEQPLVEGLVDVLEQHKIRVFGPSKNASQLEGSKIFMKKIADDNNVPTAQYQTFEEAKTALEFVKKIGFPCVIKADGLASGKGVIIAQDFEEAHQSITEILSGKFGNAGKKIIIEEFLKGFEASYFVICDGVNFLPLGFAHDHKKVGENETGLNTGGMGTFAPSPFIDKKMEAKIIEKIIIPTLDGMNKINARFRGILFAGLMIDGENPKLLEFNTRFGDPETQVILPRIKSDFVALIESAIDGDLGNFKIEFDDEKKLVCVVICSNGYPEDYKKNVEIKNLYELEKKLENGDFIDGVTIIHAGTIEKDNKILAIGGRVLNVVASANNFSSARQKAYKIVDMIDWKDGFVRNDIAKKVENF
jgi:phosphoribosylamine--glycine ligase